MTPRQLRSGEDMAPVLVLLRTAFAGMEGRIDPPSSLHHLTEEGIAKQARTGEVWVICEQACIFLTPRPDADPPELYLGKLAVHPSAQRQGLARALIHLAEQRALALGLTVLRLKTRVELVENYRTFERLGFSKFAAQSHPGFDRPTSFEFSKVVTPKATN
ncbi:GNAT family N-acetyltransferase [Aliiroseovarius marinus]|uniref:GNAT family N-acetyltransferase n=1 Tax=Aliiroseovarius marinus TaxID=2500159 RepID=UPI0024945159|nr:GNAT family N-acetyltransferase [Aliiroseovarius marinus]